MGSSQILLIGIGAVVGLLGAFTYYKVKIVAARKTASDIRAEAEKESGRIKDEFLAKARKESDKRREHLEGEIGSKRKDLESVESRLAKKEDNLDRKFDLLNKKESYLENKDKSLDNRTSMMEQREQELEQVIEEEKQNLFRVTNLSPEEGKKLLLQKLEQEFGHEQETMLTNMLDRVKESAETKGREILASCIQRLAASYCRDITTSTIEIPNDEMKGRLIGREGRNIRALEAATGVDILIDDTPEMITISCFDPIRREVARLALEKLIQDGRIHPARIEDIVGRAQTELDELSTLGSVPESS